MSKCDVLERVKLVGRKYLGECEDWEPEDLVRRLELQAYELVRQSKSSDAKSIFIAVAELELAVISPTRVVQFDC